MSAPPARPASRDPAQRASRAQPASPTGTSPAATSPASRTPALLGLVANAAIWGVSWLPFRWLDEHGVHALWTTALMYVIATGGLTLLHRSAWRALARSRSLWLLVVAAGSTNAAFNWGVTVGEVTRVVLLFYLMPAWLVLFAWRWLDEVPGPLAWLRVAMAIAGAAIVLWQPGAGVPWPVTLADGLGLAGGVAFALTNLLLRREAAASTAARALAMFAGGALIPAALALALGAGGIVSAPPPAQAGWLLPLAAFSALFVIANLALQYGAARLPASVTGVVMLSEVVFAVVSAAAIAGEWPGGRALLGGALIVAAALVAALAPGVPGPDRRSS